MITKFIIILISTPFKIILFLTSPTYFKKVTNIGKIYITNDNVFSTDKFSKDKRRAVVTYDDGKNIKLNKIVRDKNYKKGETKESIDMQKLTSVKIDHNKYSKSLKVQSVVNNKQYEINRITNKKFKSTDKELIDTGEKLTRSDMRKVNNMIHK